MNIEELLVKLSQRRCSKEEIDYLLDYFKSESVNDLENKMKEMWNRMGSEDALEGVSQYNNISFLQQKVWNEIKIMVERERVRLFMSRAMRYAAVFVGIAVISILSVVLLQNDKTNEITLVADGKTIVVKEGRADKLKKIGILLIDSKLIYTKEFIANDNLLNVPNGKKLELLLPDSSVVWLNSGSQLSLSGNFVDPAKNVRELRLNGEAYLSVQSEGSDFVVMTRTITTKVLGTKFVVTSYDNMDRVVLEEGSVQVSKTGNEEVTAFLRPGEMAMFYPGKTAISIDKVEASNYTLWTEGVIMFNNERFADILKTLEREFSVVIDNQNPELPEKTFTGRFAKDSIETILSMFELTNGISYTREKNTITIKPDLNTKI